ncbi:MAG: NUDIX domain-containing protein [Geminicoccaceae bacterium]
MDERRVDLVERVLAHDGYFKIVRYRLRHSLFEGGMGPEITREVFDRGQAVAVLPYDPTTDQVVLIEQFRPGAYGTEADPWLIETVAGIVEQGEEIEDVVKRETEEETGLYLQDLRPIARYFASPGGSSETVDLFIGHVKAADAGGIFGLASEGEDIKVHVLDYRTAMDWLQQGKIKVATTIIALQWLSLHRQDIRDQWTDLP